MRKRARLPVGIMATTALCLIALASALAPITVSDRGAQAPPPSSLTDWRPQFGDCVRDGVSDLLQSSYVTVDCRQPHAFEVFLTGDHTGEIAAAETPPLEGSVAYRTIWRECDAELDGYLGGSWRERNLRLWVEHPVLQSWKLGVRWYACTVMPADGDLFDEQVRGGFHRATSLRISCYQVPPSGDAAKADCVRPHNAEFVHYWQADYGTWKQMRADLDREMRGRAHPRCKQMIDKLKTGIPLIGSWLWPPSEQEWAAGDRTIRCFLWHGAMQFHSPVVQRQV